MSSDGMLSIVMPACEEERRIPAALAMISGYFPKAPFDVDLIAVDDGSRDQTGAVVRGTAPRLAIPFACCRMRQTEVRASRSTPVSRRSWFAS